MHRRIWIRQTLVAGLGLVFFPALAGAPGAVSLPLQHLSITEADEQLVAAIADTIIPATDTPGAANLNLHHFVLKMFDDCYSDADRRRLQQGLQRFEDFAQRQGGKPFVALDETGRLGLLRTLRDDRTADADLRYFAEQVRRWTIRGFETSEYVLTQVHPYQLVPGGFDGCAKISNV